MSWLQLLKQRIGKKPVSKGLGLEYGARGISISVVEAKQQELIWHSQVFIPIDGWQSALKEFVKQNQFDGASCCLVLANGQYQYLQAERPAVDENEIAQALGWSMKELLTSSEPMIFDYFDMPAQPTGANNVNVVAVPRSLIESLSSGVQDAGLVVESISIEELAYCDLLGNKDEATVTVFQEPAGDVTVNIVKQGQLYFTRKLRGYEQISSLSAEQVTTGVAETLALEVQRSLDYFESQLRQGQAKQLKVCMDTPFGEMLASTLEALTLLKSTELIPEVDNRTGKEFSCEMLSSLGAACTKLQEAKS